jgi:hypothetical protein
MMRSSLALLSLLPVQPVGAAQLGLRTSSMASGLWLDACLTHNGMAKQHGLENGYNLIQRLLHASDSTEHLILSGVGAAGVAATTSTVSVDCLASDNLPLSVGFGWSSLGRGLHVLGSAYLERPVSGPLARGLLD